MFHISKPAAIGVLIISIVFEVIGTSCLEACHGFQDKKLTIILIICYLLSYGLFAKVLHLLDLAVAYATWTAMGTIACTVLGLVLFGQLLTVVGWIAMIAMCIGVFLLNMFGTPPETPEGEKGAGSAGDAPPALSAENGGSGAEGEEVESC